MTRPAQQHKRQGSPPTSRHGAPTGETVTFALDGITYEIDLSTKNAEKLRGDLGKYIDVARKLAGSRTPRRGGKTRLGPDAATIKAWATPKASTTPPGADFPKSLIEAFEARTK